MSPHPSREGRGSFPGGCVWLAANRGGEGEGSGGGGMGGRRTNINCDGLMWYLNSAHPHRLRLI